MTGIARNSGMKQHPWLTTGIVVILLASVALSASARPIDAREVSLLLRAKESEASIVREINDRKLLRKLSPEEEKRLRGDGASDILVRTLRSDSVLYSQADVVAYEKREAAAAQKRGPAAEALDRETSAQDVRMFNVAFEHPVNLSYWGGPDLEVVFHRQPRIDFGQTPDFHLINPIGTGIHTSTYLGFGAAGWVGGEAAYTSATAHSFARPMWMDRSNPVSLKGLPYMLYPAYAAGDVALYYVCDASADSVRLALIARR